MTTQQQREYWWRMQMQRRQALARFVAAGGGNTNAYDKIETKSADGFLNYIEYDAAKISPAKINSYLKASTAESGMFALGGRCTGCRKGDFVLRQLDWYYNEEAEFVIRMKKCEVKGVKYDSIGVTACSPKLTRSIVRAHVAGGAYNEYFDMLPYMTVDGVNSAGVFAQSNVVEKNGVYPIDINPAGTDCCCSIMLVRFILDHVGSVSELYSYLSTLHLYSAADKYIPYNTHILVCDKTGASKVIEFVKNADESYGFELVDSQVMANFRTNGGFTPDPTTGEAVWNTVEWNGMGVERWNRCAEFVRLSAANVDNFKKLRKDLAYTHAYDRPANQISSWLTDNISSDLSVSEAKMYHDNVLEGERKDRWDSVLAQYRAMYDGRSRDTGKTWHTTHSCIYDLANLSCNLASQESNAESWNIGSDGTMERVETKPDPTTGGTWMGRYVAENEANAYFCPYNETNGRWELDWLRTAYVTYSNGKWRLAGFGENDIESTETSPDAKSFSVTMGSGESSTDVTFTWSDSSAKTTFSVASPSDDSPNRNGRLRFNGLDYEFSWPSEKGPKTFLVGNNETVWLSAGQTDGGIVEFDSWSNGSTAPRISVGASDSPISANYAIHKIRLAVQTGNDTGMLFEVPNATLVIDGEETAFGEKYITKSDADISIDIVVSEGNYRFVRWYDTLATETARTVTGNTSHNLVAVFEKT